ncbi:MAG TPA: PQQ-dependent sugar dehydrogenase, partial [Actinomycetota bacterium]|nr:PQQ-dependent sugar dehydrogenase [Actinomycetota bacterium]
MVKASRRRRMRRLSVVSVVCGVLLGSPGVLMGVETTDDDLRAPQGPEVGIELVAEGLTSPIFLTESPDDSGRLFIVDQAGQIRILDEEGTLEAEPFLDLSDKLVELIPTYDERGVLGLAFHPEYEDNGRLFVYYSVPLRDGAPEGWNHTARFSEFRVSEDNENEVDPESERVVMEIDKPQANHNGG